MTLQETAHGVRSTTDDDSQVGRGRSGQKGMKILQNGIDTENSCRKIKVVFLIGNQRGRRKAKQGKQARGEKKGRRVVGTQVDTIKKPRNVSDKATSINNKSRRITSSMPADESTESLPPREEHSRKKEKRQSEKKTRARTVNTPICRNLGFQSMNLTKI